MLLVFLIIAEITELLASAALVYSPNDQVFAVSYGPKQCADAVDRLAASVGLGPVVGGQGKFPAVTSAIDMAMSAMSRLEADERTMWQLCSAMTGFGRALSSACGELFDGIDAKGKNAAGITQLLATPEDSRALTMLPGQVVLARRLASRASALISDDGIITQTLDVLSDRTVGRALMALMRESIMRDHATRVLTVGIPAGMLDTHIRNHITVGAGSIGLTGAIPVDASRAIRIDVWMRSSEFPTIIFRSQRRHFDALRFVELSLLAPSLLDAQRPTYDAMIGAIPYLLLDEAGQVRRAGTGTSAGDYPQYAQSIATEIGRNHIVSELLSTYLRLMTGIDTGEQTFTLDDGGLVVRADSALRTIRELINLYVAGFTGGTASLDALRTQNPKFDALIATFDDKRQYIGGIGTPVTLSIDGATKAQQVQLTEDMLTFLRAFRPDSLLSDGSGLRARVLAPKLFDRVFNIAIDPYAFEVDVAATQAQKSGAAFMNTQAFTRAFEQGSDGIFRMKRSQADVMLSELFVTVGDLDATV